MVGGGVDGDGVYGVEGDEGEVADGVSAYGSSDWMDWMVGVFITAAAFVMRLVFVPGSLLRWWWYWMDMIHTRYLELSLFWL